MIGKTISHYRVLEKLGGGGMGVVYKGLDTLLDRPVALKVLSPEMLKDQTAVSAFIREAKAASALNHPHILTVHDLVEAEGVHFLVMELVEGRTLRGHIGKKGLELKQLLSISLEIAEALAAAHKAGIVHRDLKPENIMVRPDGHIKVVDFGLAKLLVVRAHPPAPGASAESTVPLSSVLARGAAPGAEQSHIAGTLPYMSPEQLTGKPIDHRSDIFSFGVVLYEMATGQQPFQGRTTGEIMEGILTKDPRPITDLSRIVPERLQEIVSKCLEKDPADRYQHIEDIAVDLRRLKRVSESGRPVGAIHELPLRRRRLGWPVAVAGAVILLAGSLLLWLRAPVPAPKVLRTIQLTNTKRDKMGFVTDGSRIYFSELLDNRWRLAQVSSTGGEVAYPPSSFDVAHPRDISPSGSELLVAMGNLGREEPPSGLWIVPVLGGSPRLLAQEAGFGAWSPDGQLVAYTKDNHVCMAKSDGSEAHMLVTVPRRGIAEALRWSPDGRRLRLTLADPETNSEFLWEVSSDGTNPHPLPPQTCTPPEACSAERTPDGKYLVFVRDDNIWALRQKTSIFEKVNKEPVQLTTGPMNFVQAVPTKDGRKLLVKAWLPGGEIVRYDTRSQQFAPYLSGVWAHELDFSRDGKWVTYVAQPEDTLWCSRVDGSDRLQLTFPPTSVSSPRWSPDGKRIAFSAQAPAKPWKVYTIAREGGNPERIVPQEGQEAFDVSWSPDGNKLAFAPPVSWHADRRLTGIAVFHSRPGVQQFDFTTKKVSTLPASEGLRSPRWSPDGRYLAALSYMPDMRPVLFDYTTSKWNDLIMSHLSEGIAYPTWSRDGKSIYFTRSLGHERVVARVRVGERKVEQVVSLKDVRGQSMGLWFGLAPDDSPLAYRLANIDELYALEWEAP